MAANGSFVTDNLKGADQTAASENGSTGNSNLSKDEVGWYFVEQYYTTLSKTPEKLHLFYGKRSQFVYGKEAEVATVSVGRPAIQERIKELDFQDCKVRVTNVDSMASFENIVIQVIGETSNRNAEPSKFCQTFVLAPQPSGYFVVNDILRFISEDEEEEVPVVQGDAPAVAQAEEKQAPVEAEEAEAEEAAVDVEAVDEKLEEAEETPAVEAAPAPSKPEVAVPEIRKAEEPAKVEPTPEPVADPEIATKEIEEEDIKEAEKPVDPSPTPAAPAQAPARPAAAVPLKPMSWASRAAAAASIGGAKPAVPAVPKAAAPAAAAAPATQGKPAAPKPAAPTAAAAAAAPAAQQTGAAAQQPAEGKESSEWQSVTDSKRQNRPQSISGPPADSGTLGYVKYVTDKVDTEELRASLQRHGELTYFDVNRQKNCAFVEFASAAGYQAAAAANPHVINGESIVVEPRRPKAGAYGGSNYASGRGNAPTRGRGGFEGQRTGSQGGGRGNFTGGQGRGRGGAPRGRGTSQTTNA